MMMMMVGGWSLQIVSPHLSRHWAVVVLLAGCWVSSSSFSSPYIREVVVVVLCCDIVGMLNSSANGRGVSRFYRLYLSILFK